MGAMVGKTDGVLVVVGDSVLGFSDGTSEGGAVGSTDGTEEGAIVGRIDGRSEGVAEGLSVGADDGAADGVCVSFTGLTAVTGFTTTSLTGVGVVGVGAGPFEHSWHCELSHVHGEAQPLQTLGKNTLMFVVEPECAVVCTATSES